MALRRAGRARHFATLRTEGLRRTRDFLRTRRIVGHGFGTRLRRSRYLTLLFASLSVPFFTTYRRTWNFPARLRALFGVGRRAVARLGRFWWACDLSCRLLRIRTRPFLNSRLRVSRCCLRSRSELTRWSGRAIHGPPLPRRARTFPPRCGLALFAGAILVSMLSDSRQRQHGRQQ